MTGGRPALLGLALSLAALVSPASQIQAQTLPFLEYARISPEKVMRAESCGECHIAEYDVWQRTPHATGFKTLHRRPRAEEIAAKLGFRLIKRQSFCYSCHYTPEIDDGAIRVVSGVSCESCHGAGRDWIDVHSDYGGAVDHSREAADHRRARIARSRAAGMRRPSDLYPVVANCFSCHTVPNEDLVNTGGHSTGSSTFEFVEWSQGEIRHNFLASTRSGATPVNAERPIARRRPMYVVGRALDLEYSLRGMAEAKTEGIYSKSMARRVRSALAEIREIATAASLPEVEEMLEAVRDVRVKTGNRDALLGAARRVGAAAQRFLQGSGEQLAALDPLILGTAPQPAAGAEPDTIAASSATTATEPGVGGPSPAATPSAGSTSGPTKRSTASQGTTAGAQPSTAEGAFKTRIRPTSTHGTLGPGSCGGCHTEQNEWWFDHAHFRAADAFFDGERKNLQIAQFYGLSPSQVTRGNQICMDCHGTVVSGKETRDVLDGVGCEACHGPAADWLEPHKVEGGGTGANRPGYVKALGLGKRDLRKLSVRAEVCTGCHYIAEPRLLSAGHPSGSDFDYLDGMRSVRHWESPVASPGDLTSAFDAALSARGPLPTVRLAKAGSTPSAAPATTPSSSPKGRRKTATEPAWDKAVRELATARVLRARPRPYDPEETPLTPSGLELPAFPEIDRSTPFEDVLLILKERLALLYRSSGFARETPE